MGVTVMEKTGMETEARNIPLWEGPALHVEDPITFSERGEWTTRERTIWEQTGSVYSLCGNEE